MLLLDIDLDVFVRPIAGFRRDDDPRPSDAETEVDAIEQVKTFLCERCKLDGRSRGRAGEHHVEVLDVVAAEIAAQRLTVPLTWIHVDAHDDFAGAFSDAPSSANFLYHVIMRGWIANLQMTFPLKGIWFPKSLLSENPQRVQFAEQAVPLSFSELNTLQIAERPDFVFLARSPAYTPAKADKLYDFIRSLFREA